MMFSKEQLEILKADVKSRISDYRYIHTVGISKAAQKIAEYCYDGDISEIVAAALLHDISKEYSAEEQYNMIKQSNVLITDEDAMSEMILHAFTAPYIIRRDFSDFATDNILSAVFNHTTGREDMSLFDEIIFIADYVEENRKYASCIDVREELFGALSSARDRDECIMHLHRATVKALDHTIVDLVKKGCAINPRTVNTRNAFLGRMPMVIS